MSEQKMSAVEEFKHVINKGVLSMLFDDSKYAKFQICAAFETIPEEITDYLLDLFTDHGFKNKTASHEIPEPHPFPVSIYSSQSHNLQRGVAMRNPEI